MCSRVALIQVIDLYSPKGGGMLFARIWSAPLGIRRSSIVKIAGLAILATLSLAAGQASAMPITYSITGNGIYDNPVGSFTYDASPGGGYSNVSIWSLDYYGSASGSANSLSATGSILGWRLNLNFSGLPTSGGSVSFTGTEGLRTFFGHIVVPRSGTIDGAVNVPEPGALFLLGAGLIGLGLVRRRSVAKT
jgi:hypothetical protein